MDTHCTYTPVFTMKYAPDARLRPEKPQKVPLHSRQQDRLVFHSASYSTKRRSNPLPDIENVSADLSKHWLTNPDDTHRVRLPETPANHYISLKGIAWKSAGPAAKNRSKRGLKTLMHTVAISILVLVAMSGAIFGAYYVLSCYGVY